MSLAARLLSRFRPYRLHSVYERLLGTEVELQVVAGSRLEAEAAERAALGELERLTLVLNRFDERSELRQWLSCPGERVPLGADLRRVLQLADEWRQVSGGAFHPGADALGALWQQAEAEGRPPGARDLQLVTAQLEAEPWTLHDDGTGTLHTTLPLGLNALAKGFIVDRMAETAHAQAGVQAVLVNAGGDLRTLGGKGVNVTVANPFTARDDARPLGRVHVKDGALATSGRAHRGYRVGETWYSHVIDPRSGQPVQGVPGVSVKAPTCAAADALATVLSVLPLQEGLATVDRMAGAAALIVTADGEPHRSGHWTAF
ncbi:FAD:protein FMN transferase [Deinococcus fonticola]|uniref:FAD:protein FMN transferase n=1 Tax=Deinococcus fonticola TaxID=2528713 RepID=UPI0010754DF8|nr:FAD:protein FMN transferase [Deinococcus fonticola]